METQPANARVPRQFGRYQLVSRMGHGGMAEIWRALDESGRTVVVKRMLPDLADSDEVVDMFRQEASLSTRFRHPGIVTGYDSGEVDGEPFLAMEYLAGRNLNQVMGTLANLGRPPVGFGVYVAHELCRALAYVHSVTDSDGELLQLVHRDVSPANVMIGSDGAVKLLDFGIAKPLNDPSRERTQAGILKGKMAYLSPEGVEERALDHRSDQFAVGIVLHEMLTGRRLFRCANDLETLRKVVAADVAAPSSINPAVPPELDRICLKALSRNRKDRFASCRDMALELDGLVNRMGWTHLDVARLMGQLFGGTPEAVEAPANISPIRATKAQEVTPLVHFTPVSLGEMRWLTRTSRRWARQAAVAVLALFASLGGVTGWHVAAGHGIKLAGLAAAAGVAAAPIAAPHLKVTHLRLAVPAAAARLAAPVAQPAVLSPSVTPVTPVTPVTTPSRRLSPLKTRRTAASVSANRIDARPMLTLELF